MRRAAMAPDHAHGAGLGRRGKPHEDGAEHDEDQAERGHHAAQALLPAAPSRCSVRASGGSAGTSFGQMTLSDGDPDAEQARPG